MSLHPKRQGQYTLKNPEDKLDFVAEQNAKLAAVENNLANKQRDLVARDNELLVARKTVEELGQLLIGMQKTSREAEGRPVDVKASSEARHARLAAVENDLADKQRKLAARDDELQVARKTAEELGQLLTAVQKTLQETEDRAAGFKASLEAQQAQLAAMDNNLAEQQHELVAQAHEIELARRTSEELGHLLTEKQRALRETEGRAAEFERTLGEHAARLAAAEERFLLPERSIADRERERSLFAARIAAITAFLWNLLVWPFRALYRLPRKILTPSLGVKLKAAWRHPTKSVRRKEYRLNMQPLATVVSTAPRRRSRFGRNIRAIARHPFSPQLRKEYRNRARAAAPTAVSERSVPLERSVAFDTGNTDANLYRRYVSNAGGASADGEFVPLAPAQTSAEQCDVKIVAYYLPQFHPMPENDEWWGKGFTEWRNVARAFPVFDEHYQPRLPGELGYYDLRVPDVMRRQVELAKHHGIAAFCFHFYWFAGKRLLELPIDNFLRDKDLDLQFSLCWANENWSRRWDGGSNELLIAQDHSPEDSAAFIRYLDKYFRDSRYMRIDGKPVLTVYRPDIIPNIKETIALWRRLAVEMGHPGLYLIATNSFAFRDYDECGFDALSEFPPHTMQPRMVRDQLELASLWKGTSIYSYSSVVDLEMGKISGKIDVLGTVHPGIMPSWDNSARRPYDGHIYHGSTPALFTRWLRHCFRRARQNPQSERLVFINAWNEWAEGAYLEPDQRFGYAYLSACAATVREFSARKISAIVPNYNHARFLKERLASITDQTVAVTEIVILDDASTDDSREVIASIAKDIAIPVKTVFNDTNSGSVFSQWAKGISLAEGDLIWICESDDTCDRRFLATLSPYFDDSGVMLAFGKVEYIDETGRTSPELEDYMEGAAPGYWQEPRVESAHAWFQGPFGIRNVIPNVGGCVFRRQQIGGDLLQELKSYKVSGDWFLYSRLAHGGRIAYDPGAQAYFRRHGANTSVLSYETEAFYEEHISLARALRRHRGTGADTIGKMLGHMLEHHRATFGDDAARDFADRHPLDDILAEGRTNHHVLIAVYGFRTGGGEIGPIHLANALAQRGFDVSLLIWTTDDENEAVRRLVAPGIPVFEKSFVQQMGVRRFLEEFGVSLINTHNVVFDMWLHETSEAIPVPFVVTHHGSYEVVPLSDERTRWLLANVDHWIYIADKNLGYTKGYDRDESAYTKLRNAMPKIEGPFTFSREDLGVEPDAFVFGLASRAVNAKGWEIAIKALRALRAGSGRPVHLLLCGDGEALAALKASYGDEPGVHFLGYQERIQAFYRLCDCCILPTRYPGESYPLTLIEAFQSGIPAIATDIGEIPTILHMDSEPMGILVPRSDDAAVFGEAVRGAMERMLDREVYEGFRRSVAKNGDSFSIESLAADYAAIYQRLLT